MGKNNEALLKIAESYLGMGGSVFRKFCGLPSNAAWCNAFVDYVAYKGDDAKLYFDGKKMTYCPTSIQWCYRNLADIPPYLAMPMDIIYFDWEKNGVPNHIGFVRKRKDCESIYTVEGNTSGGKVANRERPVKYVQAIFRPAFKGKFDTTKKLEIDGQFGYNSIAMLQRVLMITQDGILGQKTVKALQKFVGVKQDGSWGTKTSKAVQKLTGTKQDGYFGPDSVKALQKWLNKQAFLTDGATTTKPTEHTTSPKKTAGQKIGKKANELAYKTNSSKADYPNGKPTEAYKKSLAEVYPNHDKWGAAPSKGASCDVFVGTAIRASGVDKKFPRGLDEQWPHLKSSDKFKTVEAKLSNLKDGDIITYQANSGTGHICIYYDGKIKEAGYQHYYGKTTNTAKDRISKSDKKWVKVYRAK